MAVKLILSSLPLLNSEWDFLDRYDIYMVDIKDPTSPPSVYGQEPYDGDGREYPDYKPGDIRTINIKQGVGVETFALAELFLYDHYKFSTLVDKKACKGGTLYSFKVRA